VEYIARLTLIGLKYVTIIVRVYMAMELHGAHCKVKVTAHSRPIMESDVCETNTDCGLRVNMP